VVPADKQDRFICWYLEIYKAGYNRTAIYS